MRSEVEGPCVHGPENAVENCAGRPNGCPRIIFSATSSIHQLHHVFRIACPSSCITRKDLVAPALVLCGKLNVNSSDIFFQIFTALGTRNRHNILSLRQHPSQSQLRGPAAFLFRYFLHPAHQIKILLEVIALESRRIATVIVGGEIIESFELPSQETASQWAVGHEPDAQFATGG